MVGNAATNIIFSRLNVKGSHAVTGGVVAQLEDAIPLLKVEYDSDPNF
jgi:hypothetical protein